MLLVLALACAPKDAPPLAVLDPAGRTDAPPPRSPYGWKSPIEAPCPHLASSLWSRVGEPVPVQVVVVGSFAPPEWFVPEAAVETRTQGTVPGEQLCALATLPGVTAVEPPRLASPKELP